MIFDADRVPRVLVAMVIVCVALVVGIVAPKLLVPDVHADVQLDSAEAQRYVEARVGNAGGLGQKALRTQVSIIDSRPDPAECDWGYPQPVTEILTVRTYTLWGIPLETWEVTCNSERLVSGPFSW